jgi:hypothetical protein
MNYDFHPEAEAEFLDAIEYYESCEPGLGQVFAVEVFSTIERITAFPDAWPILTHCTRRCRTKRFPYGIVYSKFTDEIYILAVMHLRRSPEYWKQRI